MPSARERTATAVTAGVFRSIRMAKRTSIFCTRDLLGVWNAVPGAGVLCSVFGRK
jgi:hypothetical protein